MLSKRIGLDRVNQHSRAMRARFITGRLASPTRRSVSVAVGISGIDHRLPVSPRDRESAGRIAPLQQSCQTYNNSWYIDAESFSHVALTSHRPAPGRASPRGRARPRGARTGDRAPARPEKPTPTEPPNDPRDAGGEPGARGTAIPDCAPGWPRTRVEAPSPPTTEREQNPGRRRDQPRRAERKLRFAHRQAVVVYPRRRARWRPIGDRGLKTKRFVSSRPHETKR